MDTVAIPASPRMKHETAPKPECLALRTRSRAPSPVRGFTKRTARRRYGQRAL